GASTSGSSRWASGSGGRASLPGGAVPRSGRRLWKPPARPRRPRRRHDQHVAPVSSALSRGRIPQPMNPDAPELVRDGPTGPFRGMLDEGVFVPSSTSREMAEGLVVNPGETVIDIGCGSGVLSFVAARMGADLVYGTDPNLAAITCASRNAKLLGLGDRT